LINVDLALYLGIGHLSLAMSLLITDISALDNFTMSSIGFFEVDPGPPGVRIDTRSSSFFGDLFDLDRKSKELA
jgi:hypothetical protein